MIHFLIVIHFDKIINKHCLLNIFTLFTVNVFYNKKPHLGINWKRLIMYHILIKPTKNAPTKKVTKKAQGAYTPYTAL